MARLTMRFLGTFQVSLDDQPVAYFRSANNQGLLVYLALQPERAVPRESLSALFWPEETEAVARNNLRQALYQLRRLLGEAEEESSSFLEVTRQTVQFNSASDYWLDVDAFLQAVETHDLRTAVELYNGELLPGFTCDSLEFEEWLRLEREQSHQLALEAMYEVAQDYLRAGQQDRAQAVARKQISLEPWREPAYRQLMQAYAMAGDRHQAVAQFELLKDRLWEELAIEPAPETISLLEAIQSGHYGPMDATDALQPPVRAKHNLPANTTPFIGRDLELAHIVEQLTHERQRLVTIVGPGGIGKTRLALAVGASLLETYADGVYFVNLASLSVPQEIPAAIAAALDYQAPDKSRDLLPQLLAMLGRRHILLILDNFEHLLDGTDYVSDVLQAAPRIAVLATSRQRLNLTSESRYELGGLELPDTLTPEAALDFTAVQLFVTSGQRANASFELTEDNVADVSHICQLVQGMPLGLVLAASWLGLLSPAEIAAEIESNLSFLEADLGDLPRRQRSMEAVFDGSWQMLAPEEQVVLARLSVFRGGFTREAAEVVAGANLRILLSLVNKSLLNRDAQSGRFTIHELLRQFASQQRQKLDPGEEAAVAHCRYFSALVRAEQRRALYFYPMLMHRDHGADRDNVRRAWEYALERGLVEELSELGRGVAFFDLRQGVPSAVALNQAMTILRQQGVRETDPALRRLRLEEQIARIGTAEIDDVRDAMLTFLEEAEREWPTELRLMLYEQLSDVYAEYESPKAIVWLDKTIQEAKLVENEARRQNDVVLARTLEARLLWTRVALGRTPGPWHDTESSMGLFAESLRIEALSSDEMVAQLRELLTYFEQDFPDSYVVYGLLWSLSSVTLLREEHDLSLHYGERALSIAKRWQDLFWISHATDRLAETYLAMGLPEEAGKRHLDSLEWHLATGQMWKTLGYFWARAALIPGLLGGADEAVSYLSFVYHHPDAVPASRHSAVRYRTQYEAELGPERTAAAWERGRTMSFDTAIARMRAALSAGGQADEERE